MKFIKKNIKLIVGIIVGVLSVSGISVYATYKYFATDVSYTKDGVEMSVADALNDLYNNKKETSDITKEITENGEKTLDKYYKNIKVNVPSTIPDGYIIPSGTKSISINGEFDVAEFEKVIVEGFDCLVMENFQMQESSSPIHYNIGFNPRLVFMVTSDNKFYWGIGNNQYWYIDSSDSGCITGTFNVRDNGFTWKSRSTRNATLYAVK